MASPTSLYRHFAEDGSLLYVGISLSWPKRTKEHRRHSRWFEQVAKVEIERFPTREDALSAEREAIKRERPKFNVVHNRGGSASTKPHRPKPRVICRDPLLAKIKGPHALVGPALVYHGETISVLVAHGAFGTAGELVEIQLGELFPELPAWTDVADSILTIMRPNDITLPQAQKTRRDIIQRLQAHLEEVQSYDTDLGLATAYATQFPSPKSRQILDKVAAEARS